MISRKVTRLQGYDYSSKNAYFITLCTKDRMKVFGEIRNGIMGLSELGNIAAIYLQNLSESRPNIALDEFIVMPDHIHFILKILWKKAPGYHANKFARPVKNSISIIVNHFKGQVKKWCNKNNHEHFEWQGRFYEHVIRDENEYWAIKNYIVSNPSKWWKKHVGPCQRHGPFN